MDKPKIYEELLKLRKAIGGLKAVKTAGGPSFAIKSSKDLGIKLRAALDELGMHVLTTSVEAQNLQCERGTLVLVRGTYNIVASDGSFVTVQGVGQGADTQDKAAGKASTYAWKSALVQSLSLPDAEMADTDDEETPIPGLRQSAAGIKGGGVQKYLDMLAQDGSLSAAAKAMAKKELGEADLDILRKALQGIQ